MRLPRKGTPGQGGEVRADSFSYTPVRDALKNSFSAYLAGEPYWCKAHEHKPPHQPGTKPCLTHLTDGQVKCSRCRPHVLPTWIGWVPLYREEDGWPIIVIVHESAMDMLREVRYPMRVLVGRCTETSGAFVKRTENHPAFRTDNEQRKCARDITADLLSMWGLPELEEWLMSQGREPRAPVLKDDGKPFSPMMQAAAQKYIPPDPPVTESDELFRATGERIIARMKGDEKATNGKHKPKG